MAPLFERDTTAECGRMALAIGEGCGVEGVEAGTVRNRVTLGGVFGGVFFFAVTTLYAAAMVCLCLQSADLDDALV